jgi:replication factor C subunit 2/4
MLNNTTCCVPDAPDSHAGAPSDLTSDSDKYELGCSPDAVTSAAQQALRRTMEIYSNTTRFALACNVSTKIIEPIQSRAAILRYSRLTDEQVLNRLRYVCEQEQVSYTNDGLEAIIFTAEGDMRNALNNLQATVSGFEFVDRNNVFKVCDQPHPTTVRAILDACVAGRTNEAVQEMNRLWKTGYGCGDIVGTMFKVARVYDGMGEAMKLEYLREIGFTHMRIADGVGTPLQLMGLVARLCKLAEDGPASTTEM